MQFSLLELLNYTAIFAIILPISLFLTFKLKPTPVSKLFYAIKLIFVKNKKNDKDNGINPVVALMTALSSTVGTGNIVGVAAAITVGGPGAVFYMWIMGIVGMVIKYAETLCSIKYRKKNEANENVGGPMFYIKEGLADRLPRMSKVMAATYAVCLVFAAITIGNWLQIKSVSANIANIIDFDAFHISIVIAIIAFLILVGGIKRISNVASALVPAMILLYVSMSLVVIFMNISDVPSMFGLIIEKAFDIDGTGEGIMGAGIGMAIRYGISRAILSGEIGLGTASIAHAASYEQNPVKQAYISILGLFIDTIIVCTMTALVILITQGYLQESNAELLAAQSFSVLYKGEYLVSFILSIFGFTTLVGWSFYGERGLEYLVNTNKYSLLFRIMWVILIPVGSLISLKEILVIADFFNLLMLLPNLIALLFLYPVIRDLTLSYWKKNNDK